MRCDKHLTRSVVFWRAIAGRNRETQGASFSQVYNSHCICPVSDHPSGSGEPLPKSVALASKQAGCLMNGQPRINDMQDSQLHPGTQSVPAVWSHIFGLPKQIVEKETHRRTINTDILSGTSDSTSFRLSILTALFSAQNWIYSQLLGTQNKERSVSLPSGLKSDILDPERSSSEGSYFLISSKTSSFISLISLMSVE